MSPEFQVYTDEPRFQELARIKSCNAVKVKIAKEEKRVWRIMISEREALELAANTSKFAHAMMVSTMMARLAERLGENGNEWKLVGLLHDLDYDETRTDMTKHGVVAGKRLKEKLPKHCLLAIRAHDHRTGFNPRTNLDKALVATDSVAIIIERNRRATRNLDVSILMEELQTVSACEPWHKKNVLRCKEIGLNLDDFLQVCVGSLKEQLKESSGK